jgi:hypothetical protein
MKNIRYFFLSNHGNSKIKTFFVLALLAVLVYVAIQITPPYMRYFKLSGLVDDFVYQYGEESDSFIMENLPKKIKAIHKDLGAKDIVIEHDGKEKTVIIDYSENVVFLKGKIEKEFQFHIEESK